MTKLEQLIRWKEENPEAYALLVNASTLGGIIFGASATLLIWAFTRLP